VGDVASVTDLRLGSTDSKGFAAVSCHSIIQSDDIDRLRCIKLFDGVMDLEDRCRRVEGITNFSWDRGEGY
jgi:hypothetical protein